MSQLCPLPGVQYYFLNRCFNFLNLSTDIPRWFHKTLQGMCFLSDKYNLSEGPTWRYMPCAGCNLPMCRKEWEGMRYTMSSAMPCGLNNPFLRLWGFVCRHGLWVGQGVRAVSGGYVVVLVWGVEFGGLMGCDPELDVLLHIPSFVLWQCWWDALSYVCLLCWFLLLDRVSLSLSFLGPCGPGSVFSILFSLAEHD